MALLASAVAGIFGTALGGALAIVFNVRGGNVLSFLLAGSGGIMISVSLIELVPEALHTGGRMSTAMGLLAGATLLFVLDVLLPHVHSVREDPGFFGERRRRESRLRKTGLLVGLGIALHNFPEGLAIGAAYAHEASLGLAVALLIALHNVPEGTAMAVPLRAGGLPHRTVMSLTACTGLPMVLGAGAGVSLGRLSPWFLSFSLGFAAGAMTYIVGDELLPEAHNCRAGHYPTLGLVAGLFLGVIVSLLTP